MMLCCTMCYVYAKTICYYIKSLICNLANLLQYLAILHQYSTAFVHRSQKTTSILTVHDTRGTFVS